MITLAQIRQKYLNFFAGRGHTVISGASLIPENDPTVLFTTAGMHPLVPYLLGEDHAAGTRLVDAQKCVRTDDIDEVGDAGHHTFFEMLGNWSLGDYFKKEAIAWSFEFLTAKEEGLGLDPKLLAVSVFAGDADAPFDEESYNLWRALGIPENRIAKLPKKNNWWGPVGDHGPCGPDTEIFYWLGDPKDCPQSFNDDNALWSEIWNNVFMEYNKQADGTFLPLAKKNVDTGLGLERVAAILNDYNDNYLSDAFINIIKKIEELSQKKYEAKYYGPMRIIADHLKAATFIIGDDKGITPSNTDQGYIVRRLIRRAMRQGRQLGIPKTAWIADITQEVINDYGDVYQELARNRDFIITQFNQEEEKFNQTLENGLREFNKLNPENKIINGEESFKLFQSYGFPLEMTEELAKEKGFQVDKESFFKEMARHQELSRLSV